MIDNEGWWYNGSQQIDVPEWAVAFTYIIEHTNGCSYKIYVGKKQLTSTRKSKIGVRAQKKQAQELGDKRRVKKVQRITKPSSWVEYWGSSESLKNARSEGIGKWKRIILEWCYSKKHATYCELKAQFQYRVLETDTYNDNINGSIYRHDTNKELWEAYKEKMKTKSRKPRAKKEIPY